MTATVQFSQKNHLGIIQLNRESALNALILPTIQALYQQLKKWEQDKVIHAVVILAKGRAFCAGGDLKALYSAKDTPCQVLDFFYQEYQLNGYIAAYKKPYIAIIDGLVIGGGAGISLQGSYPIATENFKLAMPETAIGLFPDVGMSYLLTQTSQTFANYIGLTGDYLNASQAKSLKLVKNIIRSSDIPFLLSKLSQLDLSKDNGLQIANFFNNLSVPVMDGWSMQAIEIIDTCFKQERIEEILKALQRDNSRLANQLIVNLNQKCPLSLKVTLEQFKQAQFLTLNQCLAMDYQLVKAFVYENNFYEGIRALLIDKDRNPHWQPKNLADITYGKVQKYFQ